MSHKQKKQTRNKTLHCADAIHTHTHAHTCHGSVFAASAALVMVVECESGLIAYTAGLRWWLTDAHTDGSSERSSPDLHNGV